MKSTLLPILLAGALLGNDALFDAARKGDASAVKAALDGGADVNATWRYGQTALFIAAFRGHAEVAQLLLERGANAKVKDSFYGMTALGAAADKGNAELVRLLLDKGAEVDERFLIATAASERTPILKELLSKTWPAESLTKALAAAEAKQRSAAVEALKAAGAKPRPVVAVSPERLAAFAGTYKGSSEMVVQPADGHLRISMGGQTFVCLALDESTWEPAEYPGMYKVVFVSTGDKTGDLELHAGGKVERFAKVEGK
jgi:ankyrin repeat protein